MRQATPSESPAARPNNATRSPSFKANPGSMGVAAALYSAQTVSVAATVNAEQMKRVSRPKRTKTLAGARRVAPAGGAGGVQCLDVFNREVSRWASDALSFSVA